METVAKTNAHPTPVHDPVRLKSHATFQISKELLDSFLYGRQKVERVDVGKLMEERKRKADSTDDEYSKKIKSIWCEECCKHIQGECSIHHFDKGLVLTYAVRSFPLEVQLCTSSIPGYKYGACAGKPIPCGTWIGPYEGKRVYSTTFSHNTDGAYVWEIYENEQFSHFIDGSDEEASSWMRFIRCARNKSEQNMGAFQYGQNIYYRALRDIPVSEEILVWYDHTYTQFWGVPLALNSEIKVREEDTSKKSPTVAQHSGLQGFRSPTQVPQQTPSTRPQNIPPAQRSPTMPVVTTNVAPIYSQPTTFQLQRPAQVPPQVPYQVTNPFQVQQPFRARLPSPASTPYPPPSIVPPFPMVSPSSRMPLVSQGKPISHVPSQFSPQTTRVPQLFPTHQLAPTNNPLGIPIAKTFSRSTADQKERAAMSYTTTVTSSPHYRWSPTEVKENLPVSGQTDKTDMQIKPLVNSKPFKSLPLQNRPLSLTNTAPAGPEDSGHNYVSSTVDSNTEEQGSWKCGQCGKIFGQRLILQMHVCAKSPERPFQCGHCALSFADSSELRDHVVTHTNDRPFKCGFCGRSFAGATTLNNHMRAHTGEKPFACEKCGITFAIATQLNRHIKLPGECRMRNKDAQMYNQRAVVMTAEQ